MNSRKSQREYYIKNKKRIQKLANIWKRNHREIMKKSNKKYYNKNKNKINRFYRQKYHNNKEYYKKILKEYYKKNKSKLIEQARIRNKQRRKMDINYRIVLRLRSRLRQALKNNQKNGHTTELLGCSIEFLKQHLEKKFKKDMSWSNYGKWHIDHIRPCASFDLRKPSEQRKCFHYTNLQPLWAEENLIKSDKYKELM
jgi:hypothetical protein